MKSETHTCTCRGEGFIKKKKRKGIPFNASQTYQTKKMNPQERKSKKVNFELMMD